MSNLNQHFKSKDSDELMATDKPRYELIATMLQEHRKGITKPMKLPSEEALAVKHNVARDTIRRALKVLEGHGEVTRHRGRGTFLLPDKISRTTLKGAGVGFIPPWWADSINTWYTSMVFGGICSWADEHDWHLSVLHVARKENNVDELLKKISTRKLSSLVWIQPVPEQMKLMSAISKHIPCVVVGREYEDCGLHIVEPDYGQAVKLIDDHLFSKGHNSYTVVGRNSNDPYSSSWITSMQKMHQDRGSTYEYWANYIDIKPFLRDRMAELIMDFYLPIHPKIQALVLTSSSYLEPLLANKRFRELASSELSIVAFDYGVQSMDSYWPGHKITHVSCDWNKIGLKAMNVIGLLLDGHDHIPRIVQEPVEFVSGQTVYDWSPDKVRDGVELNFERSNGES